MKKINHFIGFTFWVMVFLCMIGGIIIREGKRKQEHSEENYVKLPSDKELEKIEFATSKN